MDTLLSLPLLILRNILANLDLVLLLGAYYGAAQLMKRRAVQRGMDRAVVGDLTMWVAISAVVGGRLAYVIVTGGLTDVGLRGVLLINTGMNFYGAMAGGLLVGAFYAKRRSLPLLASADLFGLFVPLVVVVQRFTCLVTDSCYGRQAPPPFGLQFGGLRQTRFPSDLYEGLATLLLFAGLLWLSWRQARPDGYLLLAFLAGYGVIRAVVDMTRLSVGGLEHSVDPLLSIGVASISVAILLVRQRRTGLPTQSANGAPQEERQFNRSGIAQPPSSRSVKQGPRR